MQIDMKVTRTLLSLMLLGLTACTSLPVQDPMEPSDRPNYGPMVAGYVRGTFKDFTKNGASAYEDFEIAGLRWVHSTTGWNWLTCIRYRDGNRRYWYAIYMHADGSIVEARHDLVIDNCVEQAYVPFDLATGKIGQPTAARPLQPIH